MTPFARATAAVLAEIPCGEEGAAYAVRAVLMAIREPSPEMREAGAGMLFGAASDDWGDDATDVWRAMIDKVMEG